MSISRLRCIVLLVAAAFVVACSGSGADSGSASGRSAATAAPTPTAALPTMIVHKSESCGCCEAWVTHVRLAGFPVEVHNESNLDAIKERLGVPYGKGSCHTAEIDGYLIEGHVPVADIQKLLRERPDARGLVLPGMPMGSPGMEAADGSAAAFTVELVARDGSTRPYTAYPAKPATAASAK